MDVHETSDYPEEVLGKWMSWGGGRAFGNKVSLLLFNVYCAVDC
jgi:hypothetical protein